MQVTRSTTTRKAVRFVLTENGHLVVNGVAASVHVFNHQLRTWLSQPLLGFLWAQRRLAEWNAAYACDAGCDSSIAYVVSLVERATRTTTKYAFWLLFSVGMAVTEFCVGALLAVGL